MPIGSSGSLMPNRANVLDLDPTSRDVVGQPLMRITFDGTPTEVRRPSTSPASPTASPRRRGRHLTRAGARRWAMLPSQGTDDDDRAPPRAARYSLWTRSGPKLCATGITCSVLTLTRAGRLATQCTASAMSSAVSGSVPA